MPSLSFLMLVFCVFLSLPIFLSVQLKDCQFVDHFKKPILVSLILSIVFLYSTSFISALIFNISFLLLPFTLACSFFLLRLGRLLI